jgi:spermidine synthase
MHRAASLRLVGAVILAAITLLASPAPASQIIVHSERSLYRNIFVYQTDDLRCLVFTKLNVPAGRESARQSCIDLHDPDKVVFNYVKMLAGSLFVQPAPKKILIIGLGGATLPDLFARVLPDTKIDLVEIDPAIVKVAHDYFHFSETENMSVTIEDGRVFVRRAGGQDVKYDMIILDAFTDEYIPEHMMTREFIQEVKAILQPDGVLAANTFTSSVLYDNESVTYQSVFPRFYNLRKNNRVIIARNGELPSQAELEASAAKMSPSLLPFGISVDPLLALFSTQADWRTDARILTDQYSPANLLNGLGRRYR